MFTRTAGIVDPGVQNQRVGSVGYWVCHRTHRTIGYCGATFTELTELVCGVVTEGTYPRCGSVGTLQNLPL